MDTTNFQAGVHSELNVDNMGRFIILEDKMFTVDAQNPQKTVQFMVNGSKRAQSVITALQLTPLQIRAYMSCGHLQWGWVIPVLIMLISRHLSVTLVFVFPMNRYHVFPYL